MMVDVGAGAMVVVYNAFVPQYAVYSLIDEQRSIRHLVSSRGDHDFYRYFFSKHKIFLHWCVYSNQLVILLNYFE